MKSTVLALAFALACGAAHAAPTPDLPSPAGFYLPADPTSDILVGEGAVRAHLAGQPAPDYRATKTLVDGAARVESGYVKRGASVAKYIAVRTRGPGKTWRLEAYAENPSNAALFEAAGPAAITPVASKGAMPTQAALDAVYDRMAGAYRTLDADLLAKVYTADAVYISRSAKAPVESAQGDFVPGVRRFMEMSKANGTKLDLSFRLTGRKSLTPGLAVDVGYVEFVVTPGDGKPERRTTAKFLTILVRQADGSWAFLADTASDVPGAVWAKGEGRVVGATRQAPPAT